MYSLSQKYTHSILSEICFGPMKSGKSKRLVWHAETLFQCGQAFLAFKPRKDTRDGSFIKTRDTGYRNVEAVSLDRADEILDFVSAAAKGREYLLDMIRQKQPRSALSGALSIREYLQPLNERLHACIIDEIFLLDSGIIQVKQQLSDIGIHVFAGGLDRDFRREYFPLCDFAQQGCTMQQVISGYPLKISLKAKCEVCEREAEYTQRLVNSQPAHYNSPTIQIGDEEYESRCQDHHCVLGHPDGEFIAEDRMPQKEPNLLEISWV